MYRGSTPTHTFQVNVDLREAVIYITYQQGEKNILEKTGGDLTVYRDRILCFLSQEDTLRFSKGQAKAQIRYRLPDGTAGVSKTVSLSVTDILKDGVI